MPKARVELARLSALVPETSVSTISPSGPIASGYYYTSPIVSTHWCRMGSGNESTIRCVFELTNMVLGIIGTQTLIIVMVIALLVFGPQKLPEIGRQIGQAMRELKKMSGDMTKALDLEQHISMDTNYNYGSYSNYTDSSTYQEPMDQYGLSDSHAYSHGDDHLLEPAPPSKALEISGNVYSEDGTLIASDTDAESEAVGTSDAPVDAGVPVTDSGDSEESESGGSNDVQSACVDSPEDDSTVSTTSDDLFDIEESPAVPTEGRADSISDEVA